MAERGRRAPWGANGARLASGGAAVGTPVLGVMEEGEQPCWEEFSPESPSIEGWV